MLSKHLVLRKRNNLTIRIHINAKKFSRIRDYAHPQIRWYTQTRTNSKKVEGSMKTTITLRKQPLQLDMKEIFHNLYYNYFV